MTTLQGVFIRAEMMVPEFIRIYLLLPIGEANFSVMLNEQTRPYLLLLGKRVNVSIKEMPIKPEGPMVSRIRVVHFEVTMEEAPSPEPPAPPTPKTPPTAGSN